MTVTELARRAGTTPHAVRYYTRMGLLQANRDPYNGYRLYDAREIGSLRFIRHAKRLGYTLAEIREIIQDSEQGRSPCPRVREILLRRIEENRRQLEELMALQERMERALSQWSKMPDGIPDGRSVCQLIEAFSEEDAS
ncbi:MAG TPA: MerR family transcriptional regulator [Gammaproteobacteria bacterium]|nr:MerR family transcriptional regulator [Gammaproteobacteria bacterium]